MWYGVYLLVSVIVQTMVFSKVRPFSVCPMVLPAVAIAVGMFETPMFGCMFSLIMGIFADMAYVENTVMFTMLFPALAFAANLVSQFFINRRFIGYMGISVIAIAVTAAVQMLRVIATDGFTPIMIIVIVLQSLWSIPPAILAYFPAAKWIKRKSDI